MRVLSCSVFKSPVDVHWRSDRTEDRMSAYLRFLPVLVRGFHVVWGGCAIGRPAWELRVHHDDEVSSHPYWPAMQAMHRAGILRLVPRGPAPALCVAMLWRMLPAFDPDVTTMITHDVDSFPLLRLRMMLEEFDDSQKSTMIVHACESHDGVMGGGLGVHGNVFRALTGCTTWDDFICLAGNTNWNGYASDEEFQRLTVWPMVQRDAIMFREESKPSVLYCNDIRPHPRPRTDGGLTFGVHGDVDTFAPYIGSAGYNVQGAFDYLNSQMRRVNDPVYDQILACEGKIDLRRVMFP